jgi:hypothetical protein
MLSTGYQYGLGNKMYQKLNLPKTAALVHFSIYRVGIGNVIYKIVFRIANNNKDFLFQFFIATTLRSL